ncbi:MAG: hypothetical protein V3T86_01295 [Planctomycetota bacterium]
MTIRRPNLVVASALIAISAMVLRVEAHCDKSNARLKIKWRIDIGIDPEPEEADKSAEVATIKRSEWAEKPTMIYIPSDDPKDAITAKLEKAVFVDEKVAIGAKFFDTIKIAARHALEDRILIDYAGDTPHIIFLKRDYTVHATLQGRQISASKLIKAMRALAAVEYVSDFDKMVREYAKLLIELDKLEDERAVIAKLRKRFEDDPSAARRKKLEQREEALDAAMEAWEEREEELLEFRLKGEKKGAPS